MNLNLHTMKGKWKRGHIFRLLVGSFSSLLENSQHSLLHRQHWRSVLMMQIPGPHPIKIGMCIGKTRRLCTLNRHPGDSNTHRLRTSGLQGLWEGQVEQDVIRACSLSREHQPLSLSPSSFWPPESPQTSPLTSFALGWLIRKKGEFISQVALSIEEAIVVYESTAWCQLLFVIIIATTWPSVCSWMTTLMSNTARLTIRNTELAR